MYIIIIKVKSPDPVCEPSKTSPGPPSKRKL
ncbi:Protein of unknown function [Pyronema omphalodes CBS 100304]|uniref:Uncharacterized protein n=1 Tax=Pyronema omphalodes (strain CBS 100304) TaxID=1076935 RepID=U4KYK6_PYROM|nr:Protein of unknown function [Pyronema omphalodes CBS 100304]